jgi:hypothetical protein
MVHRLLNYVPDTEMLPVAGAASIAQPAQEALSEPDELEAAAGLLEVDSDASLARFVDDLIRKATRTVGRPIAAPVVADLRNRLIDAAHRTIGRVPRRRAPGRLRDGLAPELANAASRIFGLELEGLSTEDRDFEIARSFVRFAGEAVGNAASSSPARSPQAAYAAFVKAARQFAPGFLDRPPAIGHVPTAAGLSPPTGTRVRSERMFVVDRSPPPCRCSGRCQCAFAKELTMHDTDRTQMEAETEFQPEYFEYGEAEWGEAGGILTEADEMQLASELLEVRDEAELDQFLGSLISKVGSVAGKVIRSPIGQAIGGVLKSAANKALPVAGAALGGWVGGPLGAKIGSGLASAAGKAIGLEAEVLSQEDREFQGAKQFVRLAADTVKRASTAPPSSDPRAVAQNAVVAAAKQLAPGLLTSTSTAGRGQSGRWIRRGTKIVLYGV